MEVEQLSGWDYYRTIAVLYDSLIPDPLNMIESYRNIALEFPAGTHILEIGAGTGRLTLQLALDGYNVTAVDASSSMLDVLKRKLVACRSEVRARVRTLLADQKCLVIDDKFECIFVTGGTLQHCLNDEEYLQTLRLMLDLLNEGGVMVFDLEAPFPQGIEVEDFGVSPTSFPGTKWDSVRSWRTSSRLSKDIAKTTSHFEVIDKDGATSGHYAFELVCSYPTMDRLDALMYKAGFRAYEIFGDFNEGRVEANSRDFVIRARK